MSVDKFGRHSTKEAKTKLLRGIPGQGFTLTQSGDFSIENKRLCDVGNPVAAQDASTKTYVDKLYRNKCLTLTGGVYNCNGKRLTNVSLPLDPKDVANKQFVQMELAKVIASLNEKLLNWEEKINKKPGL